VIDYRDEIDSDAERRQSMLEFRRDGAMAVKVLRAVLGTPYADLPFKRPHGMEAPSPRRIGPPSQILAGGNVYVLNNSGTIGGAQIQQGSNGAR
jgi:hypothetical protein